MADSDSNSDNLAFGGPEDPPGQATWKLTSVSLFYGEFPQRLEMKFFHEATLANFHAITLPTMIRYEDKTPSENLRAHSQLLRDLANQLEADGL